ncbi:MAG: invasin domain 3-containing protein, partial [Candidatus Thermoplasmatota archaeon]
KSYYIISYDNGYSWQGPYLLSDKSASSPQLAISNGYIHAVFTSDRAGTSEIYYKRSPPFSTEPANITITANPTILTADGVSNATLTIWVYNYTGSPLPNQNVTLSTNGFGSVSNVTDNGDGSYTANYTAGTVAGNVIITATAGFVSNNTTIVLKPGAIARIEIHPPGPVTYNKTETCYYTAAGYDIYQNINTTWLPVWKVDGGVGIINETGFFTATKKGTGAVNCTDNITGIYNVSIINVLNSNPIIELIENRTAYEGQMFTLQINATDLDGDTLLFSDNSTLFDINSTTGLISFTPSYDSAGIYCVNITVTDGEALVWQNFKLEIINVNRKPVAIISLPSNNSKFSTTDEINFNASASYDPDNDNLTYVWRSNIQGLLSNAKSFSAKLSAGVHTITLTVSDGTLSDSKQITITVETPLQPSWRLTPIEGAIVTSIICVAMAVIIILRKLKRIP